MKMLNISVEKMCAVFISRSLSLIQAPFPNYQTWRQWRHKWFPLYPSSFILMRRGQMAIMLVLTSLLFLLIMLPVIETYVRNEVKWSVAEKKKTTAFHLAEAGIDRAMWQLREDSANYDRILLGQVIAGYNNDVHYTDIQGGVYRILITSTSTKNEIKIISTGKDTTNKEFRAIEVILSKKSVNGAIQAPSISVSGSAKIYWGPMMSTGNMHMIGSANQLYPRKFARGSITGTGSNGDRDASPPGDTDNLEWWSYNYPPGVPDAPNIDISSYTNRAKKDCGCSPVGDFTTECPAGSCYYSSDPNTIDNLVDTTERVRFFDNDAPATWDAKFTGSKHFRGILIVLGDMEMSGSGKSGEGIGEYWATVPAEAWKEYQKDAPAGGDTCVLPDTSGGGDKTCLHQYPGDEGYHVVASSFHFASGCIHGNKGGASTEPISFKGYIEVRGNTHLAGSAAVHGAFVSKSGSFSGGGSLNVWYDDSIQLALTTGSFSRVSWKEITPTQF